jgi:hypothetical protein
MKIPVYTFPEMFNNSDPLANFNINKIRFSDTPYLDKRCNKRIIDMYYKNNCIIFQLPRQKLHDIKDNILTLQLYNTDILEYIIKPLEEHICEIVHKYSEKWFNGKHFTMNKIVNSLGSQIKKESEHNFILNLTLNKNTLLYNRYKTLIELDHINLTAHEDSDNPGNPDIELIPLIRLSHLEFFENKFTYSLVLEQAKVFMQEKLTGYSIIETPDDTSDSYDSCSDCSSGSENKDNIYYKESLDDSKQNFF